MIGRRDFLKAFTAGVTLASTPVCYGQVSANDPHVLDIQRDRERLLIDLWTLEGRKAIAWLLRDVSAGNVIGIPNWDMLRLAAWSQAWLAAHAQHAVLVVHSGLRLPSTNARLERAALNSRHLPDSTMRFNAMDVYPYGIDKNYFGRLIAMPGFGGVGWYDSHIHFDTRERPIYWTDHRPSRSHHGNHLQ